MKKKVRYTFVHDDPSEILQALVGLKDVQVLAYRRDRSDVELLIEQNTPVMFCPSCGATAHVKDRPIIRYVDLPVYGQPMRLGWRKHRLICPQPRCPKGPGRAPIIGSPPPSAC